MGSDQIERLQHFVEYAQKLKGDERGEAQVFCDRFSRHSAMPDTRRAGATLEDRQRRGKHVKFIDLLVVSSQIRTPPTCWKPRLILEMKSRKEDLQKEARLTFRGGLVERDCPTSHFGKNVVSAIPPKSCQALAEAISEVWC